MSLVNSPTLEQASIYSDLNSLDKIRRQGKTDEIGAIKKAAKEFEAFFMNMMLKSMRQASEVIGSDSLLSSEQEKMYVGMLDEQLSVNLSQGGHLKIADLMVNELSKTKTIALNSDDLSVHLKRVSPTAKAINLSPQSGTDLVEELSIGSIISPAKEVNLMVAPKPTEPVSSLQPIVSLNTPAKIDIQEAEKFSAEKTKPEKRALFSQVKEFISELMPFAKIAAEKLRLDPRILIAQAALETGWGQYVMHDEKGQPGFNLFGIKAGSDWQGESIQIDTLEVDDQEIKKINANFRKYQSLSESFDDYVDFVTTSPRYQNAIDAAPQAKDYLEKLQSSGYATDPQYAEKILRIYEDQKIQDFELGSE